MKKNGQIKKECLASYISAGCELSEETAVAHVHQGGTLAMPEHFGLYDRLGRRLQMNAARVAFALQKRKPLLAEELAKAKSEEEAKRILLSLLDLVDRERRKGWICSDYAFLLNLGYEEGRAFRIDIGSYTRVAQGFSWANIAKPVDRYLERNEDAALQDWWRGEIAKRL